MSRNSVVTMISGGFVRPESRLKKWSRLKRDVGEGEIDGELQSTKHSSSTDE